MKLANDPERLREIHRLLSETEESLEAAREDLDRIDQRAMLDDDGEYRPRDVEAP
jgi:hypothetical protein